MLCPIVNPSRKMLIPLRGADRIMPQHGGVSRNRRKFLRPSTEPPFGRRRVEGGAMNLFGLAEGQRFSA